jgi:phosphatidylserine/phosphatidylglycerophosphate/cardiolipin synthase-like enzyme
LIAPATIHGVSRPSLPAPRCDVRIERRVDAHLQDELHSPRILVPGHNCSVISDAPRAAVLVDGVEYFCWLEKALRAARRSILIVGWDFDGRIALCHDRADYPRLEDLLRTLVEQNPDLEVRILVWSLGVVHGPGAAMPMLVGAAWQEHPRIRVRLDSKHPIYGAQHQKIVCIDDAIAFTGGIDLTVERWDDGDHLARHPARITPDGQAYAPVHDLQIAVDGEAALAIADVARQRWHLATGELLETRLPERSVWPQELVPQFRNATVGVACTMPGVAGTPATRHAATLTLDAISRARRVLYIEAQYLTSGDVEKRLARRLAEPSGPEIIIVLTRSSPGLLERLIMGANRDRLLRRLKRHDRHGRLRVCYPAVPGPGGECDIKGPRQRMRYRHRSLQC